MTKALKWQIALALLVVFFAGIAIGAFGAMWRIHALIVERHAGHFRGRMSEHLRRELQLTDQQFDTIRPIVDRTAVELEKIRSETSQRVDQTMRQAHDQIAPHLTAEQKKRLDELEQRHVRGMRHRPPPPPDAP